MTDPTQDAALRALIAMTGQEWVRGEALEAAAREALAPIRKLHKRGLVDNPYYDHEYECVECIAPWPCDTAKLIYTTEELA